MLRNLEGIFLTQAILTTKNSLHAFLPLSPPETHTRWYAYFPAPKNSYTLLLDLFSPNLPTPVSSPRRRLPKRIIKLQQPIQTPNPTIIIVPRPLRIPQRRNPDNAGHAAPPASIGLGDNLLALNANLPTDADVGASFTINADLEGSSAILLTKLQDDLGVGGDDEGSEAEASGADRGDEHGFHEGVDDAAAGA